MIQSKNNDNNLKNSIIFFLYRDCNENKYLLLSPHSGDNVFSGLMPLNIIFHPPCYRLPPCMFSPAHPSMCFLYVLIEKYENPANMLFINQNKVQPMVLFWPFF